MGLLRGASAVLERTQLSGSSPDLRGFGARARAPWSRRATASSRPASTARASRSTPRRTGARGGEGGLLARVRAQAKEYGAGVSTSEALRKMIDEGGVPWLKNELGTRGIEASGSKMDMIMRLEAAIAGDLGEEEDVLEKIRRKARAREKRKKALAEAKAREKEEAERRDHRVAGVARLVHVRASRAW